MALGLVEIQIFDEISLDCTNLHNYFNLHVHLYFRQRRWRRRRHVTSRNFAPPEGLASPRGGDPTLYWDNSLTNEKPLSLETFIHFKKKHKHNQNM